MTCLFVYDLWDGPGNPKYSKNQMTQVYFTLTMTFIYLIKVTQSGCQWRDGLGVKQDERSTRSASSVSSLTLCKRQTPLRNQEWKNKRRTAWKKAGWSVFMNHHAGLFIWIDVVSVLNINSLMQAQNMQREQTGLVHKEECRISRLFVWVTPEKKINRKKILWAEKQIHFSSFTAALV